MKNKNTKKINLSTPIKFHPIRDSSKVLTNRFFQHFKMDTAMDGSNSNSSSRKRKATPPNKLISNSIIQEKKPRSPQHQSTPEIPPQVIVLPNDYAQPSESQDAAQLEQLINSIIFEDNSPPPPPVEQEIPSVPPPLPPQPPPPHHAAEDIAKFEAKFETRNPPWKNFKSWVVHAYNPQVEARADWERGFDIKLAQIHQTLEAVQASMKALELKASACGPQLTSSPNNNNNNNNNNSNEAACWSPPPPQLHRYHTATTALGPAGPPTHITQKTIPFQAPPQATFQPHPGLPAASLLDQQHHHHHHHHPQHRLQHPRLTLQQQYIQR